jgi:superfamily I DNA and/or RNA helicase
LTMVSFMAKTAAMRSHEESYVLLSEQVEYSSVDKYMGADKPIVVLDQTWMADPKFATRERLTVAWSRATSGLVIVGSTNAIRSCSGIGMKDPWKKLHAYMVNKGYMSNIKDLSRLDD